MKEIANFCKLKGESVFVRLPKEMKGKLKERAKAAEIPLATYIRAVLDEKIKEGR